MCSVDAGLAQAREVVSALIGTAAEVEHLAGNGRNSRIYRVRSSVGEFALKQYPSRAEDSRDRLGTEVGALDLMARHQIKSVPSVVGVDREHGFALLSWIDGSAVTEVADSDVEAAMNFLASVDRLRNMPKAMEQPLAAEACLSGAEIERQISARHIRLRRLRGEPGLAAFLDRSFIPAFEREVERAKFQTEASGIKFTAELSQDLRTLVPSDFGFHNSLRRSDGSLAFVDFEYFGWDDPVKMTADLLLHPGRTLRAEQRRKLRQSAACLYGRDRSFGVRLSTYLPLFGLRWVLILLNEFLPERWKRRVLAGSSENWAMAKAKQLESATKFLTALPEKVGD